MKCCHRCFRHSWVVNLVKRESKERGGCDFCKSTDGYMIDVRELSCYFSNMISLYRPLVYGETIDDYEDPVRVGDPLTWLIEEDWQVFSKKLVDTNGDKRLLERIVNSAWEKDSGEDRINASELYTRRASIRRDSMSEKWEEFCYRVKANPRKHPTFDGMVREDLWRYENAVGETHSLYRAGPKYYVDENGKRSALPSGEMGAPPPEKVKKPGRVNRRGESVLYTADQERTAVAEMRPALGNLLTIAKIEPAKTLRILDLVKPVDHLNPFTNESISYWMEFHGLMLAFADSLSKPLERSDDYSDYIPCQCLSHYVRDSGFDGIRYPSAMAPEGSNVVVFDPNAATPTETKLIRVTDVNVAYEDLLEPTMS